MSSSPFSYSLCHGNRASRPGWFRVSHGNKLAFCFEKKTVYSIAVPAWRFVVRFLLETDFFIRSQYRKGNLMTGKHIIICGEKQTGKSTLIERLLEQCSVPVHGFYTRTTAKRPDGYHSIYLYPANSTDRPQSAENHVGNCNSRQRTVNTKVFTQLGVQYLMHRPGGIIAMDELGFMETGSPAFCSAVINCLDGDMPVLAVCKARFDVEFLNEVRNHPKVRLFTITRENRDDLYETLLPIIHAWNKEPSLC